MTIKFERFERDCGHNQNLRKAGDTAGILYDWRVLVDGKHRATMHRNSSDYEIRDPDGRPIRSTAQAAQTWRSKNRGSEVAKRANFEQFVTDLLNEGKIPTLQQIADARAQEAQRKIDRDKQARQNIRDWRAQQHGPALLAALVDLEKAAMAHRDCTDGSEREYLTDTAAQARELITKVQDDGPYFESAVEQQVWVLEREGK